MHLRSGFSLITASVIVTVAALVFVSILPGIMEDPTKRTWILSASWSGSRRRCARTWPRMASCHARLMASMPSTPRISASRPQTPAPGQQHAVAPLGPDAAPAYIVGGVIPTKTLGLPDDYAVDAFGHRFGYVVDTRATLNTSCLGLTVGGINIKSSTNGNLLAQVMHAYISYGASGYGAYPYNGLTAQIPAGVPHQ